MSKHVCHWPGCKREVPPALWGCREHWSILPPHIRSAIWSAYVAGQEITKTPSIAYLRAVHNAEAWIRAEFSGQIKEHDPGRWARLVRWVRERDVARAARRAAEPQQESEEA